MDSGKLLDRLLGEQAAKLSDDVKREHSRRYAAFSPLLRPFVGLDNFREVIADPTFRKVFVNSLVFVGVNVVGQEFPMSAPSQSKRCLR